MDRTSCMKDERDVHVSKDTTAIGQSWHSLFAGRFDNQKKRSLLSLPDQPIGTLRSPQTVAFSLYMLEDNRRNRGFFPPALQKKKSSRFYILASRVRLNISWSKVILLDCIIHFSHLSKVFTLSCELKGSDICLILNLLVDDVTAPAHCPMAADH